MCGIAGIYDFAQPVAPQALDRLTDALAHRGPDGRGVLLDGGLGLGHRRLAILDLSDAGKNPLRHVGPDGRELWITYNGEVYNFPELRAELEALGHRFQSATDTEVVAAAYARWGEACQERLNGMWAFAIWDPAEKSLFLSRDRFAIKPLYYLEEPRRFCFASELKAFLALDGFVPACDESVIPPLLANAGRHEGASDRTLYAGVRRLPGGHCLRVGPDGRTVLRRWWDTAAHLPEVPRRYEEQVERFRELFLDAVRIRMRSDVPIGTCLSGGVDSSAVAAAMAWLHGRRGADLGRCPEDWRRAYVAAFPGTAIDERDYADAAARHAGARPVYWNFDPDEALACLLDSVWAMEEVYFGVGVPAWALYREMRRGGTLVSLDGHGADELLGGYSWYLDQPMHALNARLDADFHRDLLPAILRNFDRCSMAHGVEVRMPFMDWRLVSFCAALPPSAKIGGGHTKRILRDAMQGVMHEKNRLRQSKFGFNSPMIEWFNGGLAPLIDQVTGSPLFLDSPHWDGPALRARHGQDPQPGLDHGRLGREPGGLDHAERGALADALRHPRALRAGPGGLMGDRMRFLQLLTFYQGYLDDFYRRRPEALELPYAGHLRLLLEDGFGCGHYMAPALERLGYETMLVVANCRPLQERWCRENGAAFPDWPQGMAGVVARQAEAFAPDVLYLADPVSFDSAFVRLLPRRPELVLGWRAANIPDWVDWREFDALLSSARPCLALALARGAREAVYAIPGFDPAIAEAVRGVAKAHDVVFSGSFTAEHTARNSLLVEIAKAPLGLGPPLEPAFFMFAPDPSLLPAGIAMHDHGPRWGMEMYRTLAAGRVVVNAGIDIADSEAPNMRTFEATGCGAFLLTERKDNIAAFFTPGEEVETFSGAAELLEKIRHYLAHPEEREAIAARGRARCLRDYALPVRALAMDRLVRRLLGASGAEPAAFGGAEQMLHELREHPENDRARLALSELLLLRAKTTAAGTRPNHGT